MFRTNYFLVLIGLLSLCAIQLHAQKLYLGVQAGIALGSPIGKVPEGATGTLGLGPAVGLLLGYQLTDRIGIQLAPAYAQKKGRYRSPISGTTKVSREIFGVPFSIPFNLSYEGFAEGGYDNQYIDIPLQMTYQANKKLQLYLGGQASYLLKGIHVGEVDVKVAGIINVEDEPFDQSEFIRDWDFGAMLGANVAIWKKFSVQGDIYVGLQSLFTDDFEELEGVYRNVYLKIQLAYRIF